MTPGITIQIQSPTPTSTPDSTPPSTPDKRPSAKLNGRTIQSVGQRLLSVPCEKYFQKFRQSASFPDLHNRASHGNRKRTHSCGDLRTVCSKALEGNRKRRKVSDENSFSENKQESSSNQNAYCKNLKEKMEKKQASRAPKTKEDIIAQRKRECELVESFQMARKNGKEAIDEWTRKNTKG